MLNSKITTVALLLVLLTFVGCGDDEPSVSSQPTLNISSVVAGLPGQTFTITGLVSDPAGIRSINLIYESWSLDKLITVDEGRTQFELNYSFQVPDSEPVGSTHLVRIVVTNAGGKTTETDVTVSLTLDNTPPAIAFSSPNNGGTYISSIGPEFDLAFEVTDDVEVTSVEVIGFGFNENVQVGATSYSFNQSVDFALTGSFTVLVNATDNSGNMASSSLTVNIEESLKFDRMFLADVSSDAELVSDAFGVPMLIDGFTQVDSAGVIFEARYYSKAANTEIRFIPQKQSFAPFTFGQGANAGELALGTDATVAPIVLPGVGYYKIVINIGQLSYTMETYTPTDTPFSRIAMMGTGLRVNGGSTCSSNADGSELCWNFGSGKGLTVDPSNPYLFTGTVELFDFDPASDGNNGFILGANPSGWSPFWRFNVGDAIGAEPEFTVPNGGSNFIFGPELYGTYTFEFDTHLNRAKLVPQ